MNIFLSLKDTLSLIENKKTIPLLVVLFLFNSIVEVFGIAAIAWFLVLATSPVKNDSDVYVYITDWIGTSDIELVMLIIGLALLGLIIAKSILSILTNRFIYLYSFNEGALLRKRLLKRYMNLSYEEWISKPMSEYIQSVINLPGQYSQNILMSVVRLVSEGIVFIAVSIFIISVDALAFLLFLSIILFFYLIYNSFARKKSIAYGKKINDESRSMISTITESLTGFAEIRLKNIENFFLKRLIKSATEFSRAGAQFEIINTVPRYLIEISILFFIVLFLVIFSFNGQQPLDNALYTLGVLGAASIRIAPSTNLILSAINQIRFGRDTLSILQSALSGQTNHSSIELCEIDEKNQLESIDIQSLSFAYSIDDSNIILENVSLKIEAGNIVGIKGKTGSGKSTFLALILGLLRPTSGVINFNYNSKSFTSTECIHLSSYIPQDPFIINDSIEKNIAIGVDESDISKDRIKVALEMASLDGEISKNRTGTLGDGGSTLSGGQKQRLIIARAFYDSNKLIILDEPTNALDSKTSDYIINEINKLKKEAIVILVSHDANILSSCDVVYEIDGAKINKV